MSDLLEIIDEGKQGWMSWIVALCPASFQPQPHRLNLLRARFNPAVGDLSPEFQPTAWQSISRAEGRALAADRIQNGLAYNSFQLPRGDRRHRTSERFFEHFSIDCDCFVNWHSFPNDENGAHWQPFTQSTIDLAIGVVDPERIGIICIQDED